VMKEVHDSEFTGAHLGVKKSMKKLQQRFWWPTYRRDLEYWIRSCEMCGSRKPHHIQNTGELMSIPVVGQPWDMVGVDILSLPTTKNGNKYVIVFMDYLTKWPEAVPMKNISARDVAQVFISEVLCRHGVPKMLLSDRGGNFLSDLMTQVLHQTGTVKLNTTSYHPQTDGLVERFNRTLTEMLTMYCHQHKTEWDELLPLVLFAYRTSEQASTRMDPFFLTYGRLANFPITASVEDIGSIPSHEKFAQKLVDDLDQARTAAKIAIQKAQDVQKSDYDRRHEPGPTFQIGEKVWVQHVTVTNDRIPKMDHTWFGPFEIKEQTSALNYRVKDLSNSGPSKIVHVSRLKQYHSPENRVIDKNEPVSVHPVSEGLQKEEIKEDIGELVPGDYEIEAILDKKKKKLGRKFHVHYLIKWKGYPESENSWIRAHQIDAPDLIKKFELEILNKKTSETQQTNADLV
jgi:hypothetical protein